MIYSNGELRVGRHVIYHDPRRNEDVDALIQVIFHQNGPPPPLTLILIKPGNLGVMTRSMVPHRDDVKSREEFKSETGYWIMPAEVDA